MTIYNNLYIHIPFCSKKCDYCAFYSISNSDMSIEQQFLDKLEKDFIKYSENIKSIQTIFIGGGTPNLLTTKSLKRLFKIIANYTNYKECEFTIECNPSHLNEEKINIISQYVNRVSIGIQSFSKKHRAIIGRNGDLAELKNHIELFIANGTDNISLDLIMGIPAQSIDDFKNDLITATNLPIKHISIYSLIFEENTKLLKNYTEPEDIDDLTPDMLELAERFLPTKSIEKYEISNYSKPGFECMHNTKIWYGDTYLGLGPSATSFDGIDRFTQPKLSKWLINHAPEHDILNQESRNLEIFAFGLRSKFGWIISKENFSFKSLDCNIIKKTYTLSQETFLTLQENIKYLEELKLIKISVDSSTQKVTITNKGYMFWDEIAVNLI